MKVLSLFSGVGGFDLGLEAAGMETVFQCEWDKHATNILERHWPHVPRWGDISTLTGKHILAHAPVIDVVAWGSPCQDLAVGGKRAGLEGSRSGLFFEGIRIINELRELTNGKYPRISIWENVAGALSSNKGNDFGVVLNKMAEAGACFSEWAVLDAQYFGVPQRRRRVFLISVFDSGTAARCPDPLLPVSQSVSRNTQTRRKKKQNATDTVASSADKSDESMIAFSHTQGLSAQPSEAAWPTLRREGNGQAVAYVLRDREGKPGGGKGPLVSADMSLAIKTANDQKLFTPTMAVRRLTPLECERLMGWPDDWTAGQSDTHRYKQCGNGVASPVAQWIGEILIATATATDAGATD
jgi:DNA (cytosine-5)-methyltransferase 1